MPIRSRTMGYGMFSERCRIQTPYLVAPNDQERFVARG
jgi:hypothetical protein